MDFLLQGIHYFLHLDQHLVVFLQQYGAWIYGLLFLILFCETGLVITPILPGDSLLFATGALAAASNLNIHLLVVLLFLAVMMGDNTNYWLGRLVGPKVFQRKGSLLFNPKYLERAQDFYQRYGGKTIIIARFIPIIRTFAPFVAGIGRMPYRRFLGFSIVGAALWIAGLLYGSYWFGNLPIFKENFSLVIMAIIILSVLPAVFEIVKHRRAAVKYQS